MHIKSVSIQNFRSIENQTITDIDNALILIGKNNSGKSSVITSIRAFFNHYQVQRKDFPPDKMEIQIKVTFEVEDDYFQNLIFDPKIGISKFPGNIGDFNSVKDFTSFSSSSFGEYKQKRDEALAQHEEGKDFKIKSLDVYETWMKCFKDKCKIENGLLSITAKIREEDLKTSYRDLNDEEFKFVTYFSPEISYIHDERNFSEEENGKTNTLTSDLFINKILNKDRNSAVKCSDCNKNNKRCDDCCRLIKKKTAVDLTIDDLEKLTQRQLREISEGVSQTISYYFEENYQKDYKIKIDPTCNINKSVAGLSTIIYDPNIKKELSISNVGAGLRSIYNLSLLQAHNKLYKKDLSNKKEMIYLLEEPEIYLHPSLQKEMCSTLYEISQSNQLFFTTHSPLLLKNFDSTQIRKLSLNQRYKTEISNTNISEILNEIGYSTTDIIQTEFVIFCEGKEDKERLSLIIEKFYKVDRKNILLLDTGSCKNIETYATLKFLDKTRLKENFAIIRDSDTEEIDKVGKKLLDKFKENFEPKVIESIKERILVLKYSSLECYFLNPEILCKIKVIDNIGKFDRKINNYVDKNRVEIEKYIRERNKENPERVNQLIQEIYNHDNPQIRIENIKRNVRGHNLFGRFEKLENKVQDYVSESKKDDFKELIDFLDKLDYFKQKRIRNRTLLDFDDVNKLDS